MGGPGLGWMEKEIRTRAIPRCKSRLGSPSRKRYLRVQAREEVVPRQGAEEILEKCKRPRESDVRKRMTVGSLKSRGVCLERANDCDTPLGREPFKPHFWWVEKKWSQSLVRKRCP